MPPGEQRVPTSIYYTKEFHDLEVERLWKRVWQLACHEDELASIGDYVVYDIAHLSFLLVRTGDGPDDIAAYRNACLHRGRKLRERDGSCAKVLRCPFHGWSWKLDGSLNEIPCQWDFPDVEPDGEVREGLHREPTLLGSVKTSSRCCVEESSAQLA